MFKSIHLYLYAAAAIAIGVLLWRVDSWHTGFKERDAAVKALQTERDNLAARNKQIAAENESIKAESKGYEDDLAKLRKSSIAARGRTPDIRLCKRAPDPVPSVGDTGSANVPDLIESSGSDGSNHQEGPNISGDLYDFAEESQRCAVRLTRLQNLLTKLIASRALSP